jgi:hypothetical protein
VDLDSFVTELYVVVDDWWRVAHAADARRPGRPPRLSPSEVLTLVVLAQWPRWRSERDFWRFARAHLRALFPALCTQAQFNRRERALAPELRALQAHLAAGASDGGEVYRVLDTSLVPAMRRVRACRHGLFAGQAAFGRSASHTEWVYGFKLGLAVSPAGVVTAFGLAPANCPERPVADALIAADRFGAYLADKGIAGADWEARWRDAYGADVVAAPQRNHRRAWPDSAYRWAAGKRQVVEQVIAQLKDLFALERHRAKTLDGLLARLAAKITAFTAGQWLNAQHGRPLRHLADLLV